MAVQKVEPREAVHVEDVDVSPASIETSRCPWQAHAALRSHGAVISHPRRGGGKTYAITGYEDVIAAFQNDAFSKDLDRIGQTFPTIAREAKRAGFALTSSPSKHLLNSDPPDHTRLRRLVMRAFTPRRIESLRPRIQEIVDELLEGFTTETQIDLIEDFAFQLSITMICELLGVPSDDRANFRVWSVASTTPPGLDGDVAAQESGQRSLSEYLEAHIRRRRSELEQSHETDPGDILSAMIVARNEDDGTLSDSELVGMAFLLLIAGHETTVGLIGSMAHRLSTMEGQRALLLEEPDLIVNAVEEFLRYEGPVQRSTFRVAMQDVTIADTLIPAGSGVSFLIGSANHDPGKFENPDVIDITRDTSGHAAFGQGIHFCLGAPLARAEAQIAISSLLKKNPEYRLAVSEEELSWAPTIVRALSSLPVMLYPNDRRVEVNDRGGTNQAPVSRARQHDATSTS